MDKPFQRKGGKTNTQIGNEFENIVLEYFYNEGIYLKKNYALNIGLEYKKTHKFDLGNETTMIECKTMKWYENGKSPGAKLKNWNEAMYYFHLAPNEYKKIFFVEMDFSQKYCKTLLEYYIELNYNLIPEDVIFYDCYSVDNCKIYTFEDIKKIMGDKKI